MELSKILSVIAKHTQYKKFKSEKAIDDWVNKILSKAQVDSDYFSWVYLKSNNRMWFGVESGDMPLNSFILYRQTEYDDNGVVKEYEFYVFSDLEDKRFKDFLYDTYRSHYDNTKEILLFYQLTPIEFRVKTEDGYAILGNFNDLTDHLTVETELYCLEFANGVRRYARTPNQLEWQLNNSGYFDIPVDMDLNIGERVTSKFFKITRWNKDIQCYLEKTLDGFKVVFEE